MSDLEDLCAALTALDEEILRSAQALNNQANQCSRAAQQASSLTRQDDGTYNRAAADASQAFSAAARAAALAAQLLVQAAQQGQAFVTREVGFRSRASSGSAAPGVESEERSEASATEALDRRLDALSASSLNLLARDPDLVPRGLEVLDRATSSLRQWDEGVREQVLRWFGDDSRESQVRLLEMVDRLRRALPEIELLPLETDNADEGTFAYVYPADRRRRVFVGDAFWNAGSGAPDSRVGVLLHELSHFPDIAGSHDHDYGVAHARKLAVDNPRAASENADNIEYFLEEFL